MTPETEKRGEKVKMKLYPCGCFGGPFQMCQTHAGNKALFEAAQAVAGSVQDARGKGKAFYRVEMADMLKLKAAIAKSSPSRER